MAPHELLADDGAAVDPADAPDWPDIVEMVEAIKAAADSLERLGNLSVHALQTCPLEADGQRRAALTRCRDILSRINRMQEALLAEGRKPDQASHVVERPVPSEAGGQSNAR